MDIKKTTVLPPNSGGRDTLEPRAEVRKYYVTHEPLYNYPDTHDLGIAYMKAARNDDSDVMKYIKQKLLMSFQKRDIKGFFNLIDRGDYGPGFPETLISDDPKIIPYFADMHVLPPLPLRYNNVNFNDHDDPECEFTEEEAKEIKKASKKLFLDAEDLISMMAETDTFEENEELLDHIWLNPGMRIWDSSNPGREYLFKFFNQLHNYNLEFGLVDDFKDCIGDEGSADERIADCRRWHITSDHDFEYIFAHGTTEKYDLSLAQINSDPNSDEFKMYFSDMSFFDDSGYLERTYYASTGSMAHTAKFLLSSTDDIEKYLEYMTKIGPFWMGSTPAEDTESVHLLLGTCGGDEIASEEYVAQLDAEYSDIINPKYVNYVDDERCVEVPSCIILPEDPPGGFMDLFCARNYMFTVTKDISYKKKIYGKNGGLTDEPRLITELVYGPWIEEGEIAERDLGPCGGDTDGPDEIEIGGYSDKFKDELRNNADLNDLKYDRKFRDSMLREDVPIEGWTGLAMIRRTTNPEDIVIQKRNTPIPLDVDSIKFCECRADGMTVVICHDPGANWRVWDGESGRSQLCLYKHNHVNELMVPVVYEIMMEVSSRNMAESMMAAMHISLYYATFEVTHLPWWMILVIVIVVIIVIIVTVLSWGQLTVPTLEMAMQSVGTMIAMYALSQVIFNIAKDISPELAAIVAALMIIVMALSVNWNGITSMFTSIVSLLASAVDMTVLVFEGYLQGEMNELENLAEDKEKQLTEYTNKLETLKTTSGVGTTLGLGEVLLPNLDKSIVRSQINLVSPDRYLSRVNNLTTLGVNELDVGGKIKNMIDPTLKLIV